MKAPATVVEDPGVFHRLQDQVLKSPKAFPNTAALARVTGLAARKLESLLGEHAHLTPAHWLRRTRVRHAAAALRGTRTGIANVAADSGFESEDIFAAQFLDEMRMTPGDYRALGGSSGFRLVLPYRYRATEVLAYHGRDPESVSERVRDHRILKALTTRDGRVVLELSLEGEHAVAKIHSDRAIGRDSVFGLHADSLRILGLVNEIDQFERHNLAFVKPRRGLRVPLIPTAFDALCWAITGQQINLSFAAALRRSMIQLAGERVGDMYAHPTPAALANIDASALTALRYSRSKAQYLLDAAAAVARGTLDIENLGNGSAVAAEKSLVAQKGIGVWTARYVLMRTGFADSAPVGDSGLATALQRLHQLETRPDAALTGQLMTRFAPHRSLASIHLWTFLKEPA